MIKIPLKGYLAAAFILTCTFIVTAWRMAPTVTSNPFSSEPIIDEAMFQVHAKRYNQQGQLKQVVSMHSWLHTKGQTVTQMIEPHLEIYYPDSQWQLWAKKGEGFQAEMGKQLDKLHLSDNVVVERFEHPKKMLLQLKTENLIFFPKEPMALTDDPVVLTGPDMEIQAKGMRAYLDRHAIEFLREVHFVYTQPSTL